MASWFLAILSALLVAAYYWLNRPVPTDSTRASRLKDAVTFSALVTAALWFFVDRPDASRLEVSQAPIVSKESGGWVRVTTTLTIKNIGTTALNFKDHPYIVTVSRLAPFTRADLAAASQNSAIYAVPGSRSPARGERRFGAIEPGYRYPVELNLVVGDYPHLPARIRSRSHVIPKGGLTATMEAGESEGFPFVFRVRCRPGLQLYTMIQFDKPPHWTDRILKPFGRPTRVYKSRATLDLTDACKQQEGGVK